MQEDVTLSTGGKLDVSDKDAGQAVFQVQNNVPGAHGSFSVDTQGNWTYTLNNDDPAVQALTGGPVWAWIGVVPLATGLMGWCPAYPLLGMNTCPMKKD